MLPQPAGLAACLPGSLGVGVDSGLSRNRTEPPLRGDEPTTGIERPGDSRASGGVQGVELSKQLELKSRSLSSLGVTPARIEGLTAPGPNHCHRPGTVTVGCVAGTVAKYWS
jgi:hypothetical protein